MSSECYPIAVLPHVSKIYLDYLAMGESAGDAAVRRWYGTEPFAGKWVGKAVRGRMPGRWQICWSSRRLSLVRVAPPGRI